MGGKVPFSISHESSGILLDVLGAWLPPLPSLSLSGWLWHSAAQAPLCILLQYQEHCRKIRWKKIKLNNYMSIRLGAAGSPQVGVSWVAGSSC